MAPSVGFDRSWSFRRSHLSWRRWSVGPSRCLHLATWSTMAIPLDAPRPPTIDEFGWTPQLLIDYIRSGIPQDWPKKTIVYLIIPGVAHETWRNLQPFRAI